MDVDTNHEDSEGQWEPVSEDREDQNESILYALGDLSR
jgi:hypothetical protein